MEFKPEYALYALGAWLAWRAYSATAGAVGEVVETVGDARAGASLAVTDFLGWVTGLDAHLERILVDDDYRKTWQALE